MRRLFGINLEVGHDKKVVLTTFFFFIISRIKLIKCASFVLYYIRAAAFILGWCLLILLSQMQHVIGGGA